MYDELVKRLRKLSGTDNLSEFDEAADAIEELQKAVLRMKERKRSANMTDEEYMEWGGLVFGPCHLCAYCGDGKELNDLGWCYQHERLVKPLWGCCEFEKPEGEE